VIARARGAGAIAAIAAIAATVAMIAAPAAARADSDGTVGVIARGDDRARVAAAIADAISANARAVADAVGVARGQLAAGAVPIETMAAFRHAGELADAGWRDYLRVAFDDAARQLAAARTAAEPLVALPGGAELYADASLRLGVVLHQQGHDDDARAAIALALALDPDRPVTLAEFSPDAVKLVDQVRTQAPARQQLWLAADPPGAILTVDGHQLGAAPIQAELALGPHVVVARAPLRAARAVAAVVGPTTTSIRVELVADRDAETISAGGDAATTDEQARALVAAVLRYAAVDEVVAVAAVERRGAPALLAQRCGLAGCTAVVEVGYAAPAGLREAARAAWQELRGAPVRDGAVALDLRPTAAPRRCGWCRNPYVLGGVGAAVVIGAIAAIAVATAGRPPPVVTVDPGGFGK
jgi:hypothetical protein